MQKVHSRRRPKPPEVIPLKEYPLIKLDDIRAQEFKYAQRLLELRICLGFIEDAFKEKELIDDLQLLADEWHDYIESVPYPKPYKLADIAEFRTKAGYLEVCNAGDDVCHSLKPDKHYLLSQDFATRRAIHRAVNKRPPFEKELLQFVGDSLKIMRRIELYLENDRETVKASRQLIFGIRDMKKSIANEIMDYIDRQTYRILIAQEALMKSVDAISCEYSLSCDHCDIHIWGLKDVPIRFEFLHEPRVLVHLYESKLILHIPFGRLELNMTLQAIHTNFDHLSENAKSFKFVTETGNLNFGIQDLRECLLNEFKMQTHMQRITREKMQDRYQAYLERIQLKPLHKGLLIPPQPIESDEYPDISDDFFNEENKQFQQFLDIAYHPQTLDLNTDEINLKKFTILGGIYKLSFVKKPKQIHVDNAKIHMIWHNPDKQLHIEKDECSSIDVKSRRYHRNRSFHVSSINLKQEMLKEEIDPENPLFVMIFLLPEHLCYWGQPIACHYEVFEEEEIVRQEKSWLHHHKSVGDFKRTVAESVGRDAFEFGDIGSLVLKASKVSIRPSQMKTYFSSSFIEKATLTDEDVFLDSGIYFVKDFLLNEPMNVHQARIVARSCTPYILESFKFQKEISEEEQEEFMRRRRRKNKLGMLRRKSEEERYIAKSPGLLSYDSKQNNPEYLFANFGKPISVIVTKPLMQFKDTLPSEPMTFYHLIRTLLLIKKLTKDAETQRVRRLPAVREDGSKSGKSIMRDARSMLVNRTSVTLQQKTSKIKSNIATQESVVKFKKKMKNDEQQIIRILKSADTVQGPGKKTSFGKIEYSEKSFPTREAQQQRTDSDVDDSLSLKSSIGPDDYESSESGAKRGELKTKITSHWTTKYIKRCNFNKEENKYVIETDRLGHIGFAFKTYVHFPFIRWELEPSNTDPLSEVIFTLVTQHVKCVFQVTNKGIQGRVVEPGAMTRKLKKYLIMEKPLKNFSELKKIFKEKNINIFPENDASFYIEEGYYSQKHLATEMHTYCCMALHSCLMKFSSSAWNRLAKRRDIILQFVRCEENPSATVQVHITPEETRFVEVKEICDESDEVKLAFTPTWRNINFYCDLHHAIMSVEAYALEQRCRDKQMLCYLKMLLSEIRPLSFS
uniref:CASC1 C-terminal domain-containing protein n=1 Tax=Glossina pallidipes TaxID=7398 RepID=A0A1A9ZGF4_GLOPL